MKALLSLVVFTALASVAWGAGISHLELNGNSYSNISKVYISGGNVIVLYPGGGTSAKVDGVPADFLASWGIGQEKLQAVQAAQANKAVADLERAIRLGAFREVDGVVYDTRKAQAGWVTFQNVKMFQVVEDGALVDTTPNAFASILPIFVKNLPDTIGDQDVVSFTVLPVGTYSYINKKDDSRTVRKYDFGQICSRDEIPAAVLNGERAFESLPDRGKVKTDVIAKLPDSDNLVATGSGFFISDDGYFITNDHVVRNAKRVKLKIGTNDFPAMVLREDATNDLALLKIEGHFNALPISASDATLGQAVFTIGFPDMRLQGTQPKFTDGKISSLAGLRDDPLEYQISVPVQPGNSGGPLVDQSGNVRGVVVARLDDMAALRAMGSLPQNVNYAVKGSVLREFLALSSGIKEPSANASSAGAVDTVRQAVAIVLVY